MANDNSFCIGNNFYCPIFFPDDNDRHDTRERTLSSVKCILLMALRKTKDKPKPKPTYKGYISEKDFKSRRKAWDDYYYQVLSTRAWRRFKKMREALKRRDLLTVKKLAREAFQQMADEAWELSPPKYPDPTIERRYRRLGVYEWDMERNSEELVKQTFWK